MKYYTLTFLLLWTAAGTALAQGDETTESHDVLETTKSPTLPAQVEITGPLSELEKQLVASTYGGDLAATKVLVKKGVDVNVQDQKKRTPLMFAASNGHTATVDYLIAQGAEVDAKDSDDKTALLYAAKRSFNDTIEHLVDNGANVNVRSKKKGVTALMLAAVWDNTELANMLLEHGADPKVTDAFGRTARLLAEKKGHSDIVKLLPE